MDKHNMTALRIGCEINEMSRGASQYWMLYVLSGTVQVTLRDEKFCGTEGQIVIIGLTGRELSFSAEPDFRGYLLQIHDPVSAELVQRYLLYMNVNGPGVTVLTAGRQAQNIRTVFQNMAAETHAERDSKAAVLDLLLQELLVRLYRTHPQMPSASYTNKSAIVSGIRELLEKKYSTHLTLEMIAAECNMSASYLSHIFKEITGVSIMRCLLLIRVNAARHFLSQTNLPVNEIAEKCGFNDVSNFGRTFRKETGCSPRQYRYRQENE